MGFVDGLLVSENARQMGNLEFWDVMLEKQFLFAVLPHKKESGNLLAAAPPAPKWFDAILHTHTVAVGAIELVAKWLKMKASTLPHGFFQQASPFQEAT
jgi:hypothetical protein